MTRFVRSVSVFGLSLMLAGAALAANTAVMGAKGVDAAGFICPAGGYLAGVDMNANPMVSNVRPLCVAMASDGGWIGVPAIDFGQLMGNWIGTEVRHVELFCPRDFFVAGYKGSTHTYGINSVTQLTLTCRNVKTGAMATLASPSDGRVSQFEWPGASCDSKSVANGAFGSSHDGSVIQFGLTCAMTKPAIASSKLTTTKVEKGIVTSQYFTPTKGVTIQKAAVSEFDTRRVAVVPTPTPAVHASRSAALSIHPTQTFAPPLTKDGARLYGCQTVGGQPCGQAPADAFCKQQGFIRAKTFANGAERVRAETLAGQKCATVECNAFSRIECAR